MSDIRKYIDLAEAFINPYPSQPPAFGRKTTVPPAMRHDPDETEALERGKQYASAEDYAAHNNSLLPVYNRDPVHIRQRVQAESDRLMAQWNHWKQMGLFKK